MTTLPLFHREKSKLGCIVPQGSALKCLSTNHHRKLNVLKMLLVLPQKLKADEQGPTAAGVLVAH